MPKTLRNDNTWVADTIRSRDGNTCWITGQSGSWRDPLGIYPVLQLREASLAQLADLPPSLREMLVAFRGDEVAEWVCGGCGIESALASLWLLLRSAADAFARGFWRIEPLRRYPLKVVVSCQGPYGRQVPPVVQQFKKKHITLISDLHPDLESPDSRALQTTARFAEPIRLLAAYQDVPLRPPSLLRRVSQSLSAALGKAASPVFWAAWFFWIRTPEPFRFRGYGVLRRIGRAIYGPSASRYAQRLPFGMYMKTRHTGIMDTVKNEFGALELIRNSSSKLNAPQPLDLVSSGKDSYIITSRLPGVMAQSVYPQLSDEQLTLLAQDLHAYLTELRRIPKPPGLAAAAISNSTGGPCVHARIDEAHATAFESHGPFPDEAAFHDYLVTHRPPAPDEVQRTGHTIRFSHGDLALRNVLVDGRGRLVGLVDWENAGWYPEYWELTAFHATIPPRRCANVCSSIFPDAQDFEYELAVERRLWAYL